MNTLKNIVNSKQISTKSLLYIYVLFNIFNLAIHVLGFYTYPIYREYDQVLYVIKILLTLCVSRACIKEGSRFNSIGKWFKYVVICDAIELFVEIFAANDGVESHLFVVTTPIKLYIDFLVFLSLLRIAYTESCNRAPKKTTKFLDDCKFRWGVYNLSIILIILIEICAKKSVILYLIYALLVGKNIFQFIILRSSFRIFKLQGPMCKEEEQGYICFSNFVQPKSINKEEVPGPIIEEVIIANFCRTCRKLVYPVLAIAFIWFLVFRYSYETGDEQLKDDDGKVLTEQTSANEFYQLGHWFDEEDEEYYIYQYTIENKMPEWSSFWDEKYGIINIKTGENTGAKYSKRLYFDDTGIAYDYDSHFINYKGEEVISVPDIVKAETSYRQAFADEFIDESYDSDYYIWHSTENIVNECYYFMVVRNGDYFANGVAAYHTKLNDRYGLLKDDGTLLTMPKYRDISEYCNYKVSEVEDAFGGANIINQDGKELLEKKADYVTPYKESGVIKYKLKDDDCGYSHLMTFSGEKIDGLYEFCALDETGDITCFKRVLDADDNITTIDIYHGDAELILSSNKYSHFYSKENENGEIYYLIAYDSGREYLLDRNGNPISSVGYSSIKNTDDPNKFIGINKETGVVDYIYMDGTVESTDFTYDEIKK